MPVTEPVYLLDTLTLQTLMQADAPAALRDRVRRAPLGSLWMSALSEGQLWRQLGDEKPSAPRRDALDLLLRNVPTLPFDSSAARAYARISTLQTLRPALTDLDLMVAAQALSIEAVLVSASEVLDAINGLQRLNWFVD